LLLPALQGFTQHSLAARRGGANLSLLAVQGCLVARMWFAVCASSQGISVGVTNCQVRRSRWVRRMEPSASARSNCSPFLTAIRSRTAHFVLASSWSCTALSQPTT
jgi:hypothetical protein